MWVGPYFSTDDLSPEEREAYIKNNNKIILCIFLIWLFLMIATGIYKFLSPAQEGETAPQQTIEQPIETQVDEQ